MADRWTDGPSRVDELDVLVALLLAIFLGLLLILLL